jgi:hypothetical protein
LVAGIQERNKTRDFGECNRGEAKERKRRTLAPRDKNDRWGSSPGRSIGENREKVGGKGNKHSKAQAGCQKKDFYGRKGFPHAVRPLSWSELPVDAGGYRSAKIKYFN